MEREDREKEEDREYLLGIKKLGQDEAMEDHAADRQKVVAERVHEGEMKKQDRDFELKKKGVAQDAEIQKLEFELQEVQKLEAEKRKRKAFLEGEIDTVKSELEVKKIQIEMQKLDMELADLNEERAAKHKQKKLAIEREDRKARLEMEREDALIRKTTEASLELQRKQVEGTIDAERLRMQSAMTPEQLLALAAPQSAAAAQAMGEKFKAQALTGDEKMREMMELVKKQSEAAQQMALAYGSQMADVAKAAASPAQARAVTVLRCPSCHQELQPAWRTCPYCMKSV
jgi:hypothetical protein